MKRNQTVLLVTTLLIIATIGLGLYHSKNEENFDIKLDQLLQILSEVLGLTPKELIELSSDERIQILQVLSKEQIKTILSRSIKDGISNRQIKRILTNIFKIDDQIIRNKFLEIIKSEYANQPKEIQQIFDEVVENIINEEIDKQQIKLINKHGIFVSTIEFIENLSNVTGIPIDELKKKATKRIPKDEINEILAKLTPGQQEIMNNKRNNIYTSKLIAKIKLSTSFDELKELEEIYNFLVKLNYLNVDQQVDITNAFISNKIYQIGKGEEIDEEIVKENKPVDQQLLSKPKNNSISTTYIIFGVIVVLVGMYFYNKK